MRLKNNIINIYVIFKLQVIEMEDKWINYDEEQTEIQVELSDIVFDHLINEMV